LRISRHDILLGVLIEKRCKGYKFFSKEEENNFRKNINGNFLKKTNPKIIKKLQSIGAISYCENNGYNPFHK